MCTCIRCLIFLRPSNLLPNIGVGHLISRGTVLNDPDPASKCSTDSPTYDLKYRFGESVFVVLQCVAVCCSVSVDTDTEVGASIFGESVEVGESMCVNEFMCLYWCGGSECKWHIGHSTCVWHICVSTWHKSTTLQRTVVIRGGSRRISSRRIGDWSISFRGRSINITGILRTRIYLRTRTHNLQHIVICCNVNTLQCVANSVCVIRVENDTEYATHCNVFTYHWEYILFYINLLYTSLCKRDASLLQKRRIISRSLPIEATACDDA